MPFFASLGKRPMVKDILQLNKAAGRALIHYHTAVMRQDSPLSEAERELIATLVSGLNKCHYCHGVHSEATKAYGVPGEAIVAMFDDIATAGVDEKLKPILHYVRKLTIAPSSLSDADSDAVYAAGWDEKALHDAINVACLFNFMNRLLEGHGVKGNAAIFPERGRMLKEHGYDPLLQFLND